MGTRDDRVKTTDVYNRPFSFTQTIINYNDCIRNIVHDVDFPSVGVSLFGSLSYIMRFKIFAAT